MDLWRENQQTAVRGPLSKVFGDQGFSIDVSLRPDELVELRRLTTKSWLDVIGKMAPESVDRFSEAGIENYHQLSHLLDHANLWTTHTRTFSPEVVDTISSFSLFDFLKRDCPGYSVDSEMPPWGDLGRPRMYWRLVRPGDGTDLGPIHADYWFHAVLDNYREERGPNVKLKIWIPIYLEEGTTGFAFVPESHFQKYPFRRVHVGNGNFKPDLSESELDRPLQTLATPPGTAVMFNYNLVHRGANSSRAIRTRVSMELVVNLPRRELKERIENIDQFF
jgi:phytanoyl-CoA dioxygenase PhyH